MISHFPSRVRLHRGRTIHAAGSRASFFDVVTACGYPVSPDDDQKPNAAEVTYLNCLKEMAR